MDVKLGHIPASGGLTKGMEVPGPITATGETPTVVGAGRKRAQLRHAALRRDPGHLMSTHRTDELLVLLQENPDAFLVRPGSDHSYVPAQLGLSTAILNKDGSLEIDYDLKLTRGQKRVKVIVFRTTVQTTGTFTGSVYNCEADIIQVK